MWSASDIFIFNKKIGFNKKQVQETKISKNLKKKNHKKIPRVGFLKQERQ